MTVVHGTIVQGTSVQRTNVRHFEYLGGQEQAHRRVVPHRPPHRPSLHRRTDRPPSKVAVVDLAFGDVALAAVSAVDQEFHHLQRAYNF